MRKAVALRINDGKVRHVGKEFGSASRQDIDRLLLSKLPDILDEKQKKIRVNNLLYEMAKKDKVIKNTGSDKKPSWILS